MYQNTYIDSDYLTPIEHSHYINTELIIDIYKMFNSLTTRWSPSFYATVRGHCSDCNVNYDSSSQARLSISLTMVLDQAVEDDFLIRPTGFTWLDTVIKVTKIYRIYNETDGTFEEKELCFGYVFPNQNSFNYSADTRTLSISGVDMITGLSNVRGGSMTHRFLEYWNDNYSFYRGNGLRLLGASSDLTSGNCYQNYFENQLAKQTSIENISQMWRSQYSSVSDYAVQNDLYYTDQSVYRPQVYHTVYDIVTELVTAYTHATIYKGVYCSLYKCFDFLPKDLEFEGSASILDVLTEIANLYENQTIYVDNNMVIHAEELPSVWVDMQDSNQYCNFFGREFYKCVVSENTSYNYDNIANYYVVYGKDGVGCGRYMLRSGWQCSNENCTNKTIYGYHIDNCPICNSPTVFVGDEYDLSIDRIGEHKAVVSNDVATSDEECNMIARNLCLLNSKLAETVSVVLKDTWYSLFNWSNFGVGRKIEYTSILTGETNVYTLSKLSHDIKSGTWTMELNKFFPIRFDDMERLLPPTFTYELSETGLLTMTISNDRHTSLSLYKVYIEEDIDRGEDIVDTRNIFIGETCTYNNNETARIFTYQFKSDGEYVTKCKAYNPNQKFSDFGTSQTITVNCFGRRLKANNNDLLLVDTDTYLLVD